MVWLRARFEESDAVYADMDVGLGLGGIVSSLCGAAEVSERVRSHTDIIYIHTTSAHNDSHILTLSSQPPDCHNRLSRARHPLQPQTEHHIRRALHDPAAITTYSARPRMGCPRRRLLRQEQRPLHSRYCRWYVITFPFLFSYSFHIISNRNRKLMKQRLFLDALAAPKPRTVNFTFPLRRRPRCQCLCRGRLPYRKS